jgi:hypothetical protein
VAPVNRIPSEILSLIPDFWDKHYYHRDRSLIALTHVCQAWREIFISRSSLWINLDCKDEDQARTYLERSKSLPVNLSLDTTDRLPSYHPFFEIIPHAIGRAKSLSIQTAPEDLQGITTHLSRHAPLLEKLWICGSYYHETHPNPVLTPTLFNGDLSSLRVLKLWSVRTELPWRNMVNLTSFTLNRMSRDQPSVEQFLDFIESAPRLRRVSLFHATPTSGAQNGRLVSLACLERMEIIYGGSASLLLDHLLIPVRAHLEIEVDLPSPPNQGPPPRFLDNLKNLPNFTDIHLHIDRRFTYMQFSGPNGQVRMVPRTSRVGRTYLGLESLGQFDTSKVERLRIDCHDSPSSDPPYRALLPMEHLRTLTLYHCRSPHIVIHALHPAMSSSGAMVCPKLEELVIVLDKETLDMKSVIGVVTARASRGAKFRSVRIVGQDQPVRTDVLELEKHVLDVEYGPKVDRVYDDGDDED